MLLVRCDGRQGPFSIDLILERTILLTKSRILLTSKHKLFINMCLLLYLCVYCPAIDDVNAVIVKLQEAQTLHLGYCTSFVLVSYRLIMLYFFKTCSCYCVVLVFVSVLVLVSMSMLSRLKLVQD